ncbi:transposase [Micromonospora sp. NPDC047738]|uniref:transposase n=1 Tax=Micromonospora sp. NPDC047738 TaxID=3155741 RepID=UPI0033C8E3C6
MRSAQEIIAEIGVNMTVFPTAAHMVSWAKFSPIDAQSAGRKKANSTGKGNPWLAATLGEVVAGLSRTSTFLGERYRRLARRRGKKRAIVAAGNSVLTIVWHLLTDPDARYQDLGPASTSRGSASSAVNVISSVSSNTSPARKSISSPHHNQPSPNQKHPTHPAPLRSAGCYRLPTHSPIFESASGWQIRV